MQQSVPGVTMQTCSRRKTLIVLEGNRRSQERRHNVGRLRYPERRTGFDRRAEESRWEVMRFLARGERLLAREPWRLGVLLAIVIVLAWLDLVFTVEALASGATEMNPIMASLLSTDVRLAAVVKLGVTASVVAAIWRLRAYRRIIEATLLILATMFALIAYHIALRAVMV